MATKTTRGKPAKARTKRTGRRPMFPGVKFVRLDARVPEDLAAMVRARALEEQTSVSTVLRQALAREFPVKVEA